MGRRSTTVAELAKATDLDLESVLVALWRAGIEHPDSGNSRLSDAERRRATKALDVAGAHQRKVSYWLDWFGVDREEFSRLLEELGVTLDSRSNTLPKGALKRLRSMPSTKVDPVASQAIQARPLGLDFVPAPEFPIGAARVSIAALATDEVRAIHDALEEDFAASDDPIFPIGVRDENLLEGAVARHVTRFGGQLKYPTIALAGAALLHGIVNNHPFHNGNKRTALVALLVFLDRNNQLIQSDERELFRWMLQIAAHDLLSADREYQGFADHEVYAIADWIESRARRIKREERSVQWRVLRGVLRDHGCVITRERGERERITREVTERKGRGLFKRHESRTLASHYINTSDGREVPKTQVKRIRQELHLDEEHGVDSELFYSAERAVDYFIAEYSKTLVRLARV